VIPFNKSIFFLLFLLVILPLASNPKTAQAQSSEKLELIAIIEPPSNITANSTISELNFTTTYEISRYFAPLENEKYTLPQGALSWPIQGQPISNVSIYDSLGNTFSPIISETTIVTPDIVVSVQAFSNYKMSLYFQTIGDVSFDNSVNGYGYYVGVPHNILPVTVDVRLPKNYTLIKYSVGSTVISEQQFTELQWTSTEGEPLDCLVYFMPFTIEPTVRSMGITIDVLSNSVNSGLNETFTMTYDLIGTVMIWNVSLVMPINIPFPSNESGTQVGSVFDGQGQCELRTTPIDPELINPLGKYFVDNKNKWVTIYPRSSYQDVTQKFDIQITFTVPNNSSDNTVHPDIPFYEPYKGFTSLVFNFQNSPMLHLNMTGNFKITFIFPQDVDSFSSLDGEPFVETEQGDKPTVTFNYNSPINLPKEQWVILFDNTLQRSFFIFQWYNISLLVVAVFVLGIVKRFYRFKSKMKTAEAIFEIIPIAALLTAVGENGREFIVLGWFDWFVITGLIIEILLSIVAAFFMVQIYKKRASIKENAQ
jgi:hypothetical protein